MNRHDSLEGYMALLFLPTRYYSDTMTSEIKKFDVLFIVLLVLFNSTRSSVEYLEHIEKWGDDGRNLAKFEPDWM